MKIYKKRLNIVVLAIAANILIPPVSIARDTAKLTGKHLGQNRQLVDSVMHGRNYVVEVDQQGKIKQVVDAGANGSGKEAQPIANDPATGKTASPVNGASVDLPVNYQGQHAVEYMGADLEKIAATHGFTPEKLKELLLTDSTLRIDSNKRIFYVDDFADQHSSTNEHVAAGATANAVTTANSPDLPIGVTQTTANAFGLHSKPGARKTIYLDFDGYTASNTAWSTSTIVAPAYDLDGNPSVFNDNELNNIINIWSRVAEDYIPFDVDVTTEAPSNDALLRTSSADTTYGTRVVITKTGTISCNCGGVAYVGVVAMVNATAYQPAWVFQQSLGNSAKNIAEAASHEAGHTLGLLHDGQTTGTSVNGYYSGHGSGDTGWAPIMGVGYYKNVTQWSNGAYPGANNKQDDFAVLASNGFVARTDDVGNTFLTATPLTTVSSGTTEISQVFGVIEKSTDVDMYRIDTAGGLINVAVKPISAGPNLDTAITLFTSNGTKVITSAPEAELAASINTTLSAGTYFLEVKGSAHAAVGSDYGYPTYGSLGQYQITGTYSPSGIAAAPEAVLAASTLTGPAALVVNFSANSSIGNGKIIGYQWSFGDGTYSSNPSSSHTYTKVGTFTATLTITNEFLLTNTKSVQITVTPPPPTTFYVSSLRLNIVKSRDVSAKIAITVVDAKKRPVPNALISGNWSGSFSGAVSSKTLMNGAAVLATNRIPATRGGSATFTVTGIEASGYAYNPDRNTKSVVTLTW